MIQYIGVTGITTEEESSAIDTLLYKLYKHSQPAVMLGFLVSNKTWAGKANRFPERYPSRKILPSLLIDHSSAFNIVHFNTNNPDNLVKDLESIAHSLKVSSGNLHGFQLNMAWPNPRDLRIFSSLTRAPRTHSRKYKIILQVGRRALHEIGESDEALIHALEKYEGEVDCILLDISGGEGRALNVNHTLHRLEILHKTDLHFDYAIAGGLSKEALYLADLVLKNFPKTSIDAESKLRVTKTDKLSLQKVKAYLEHAFHLHHARRT